MRNLSIRSRIMIMLILISGMAAFVTIVIGYQSGKEAITQGIFNQLTGVKSSKKYQVESYFEQMSGLIEVLGTNATVATALKDFKKGFSRLSKNEINIECHELLSQHYDWFMDELSQNLDVKNSVDLYYPSSAAACYLQYEYIIDNPNPPGDKHLLFDAHNESYYNEIHKKYHSYFSDIILKFGFYDLFLVDLEKGDIVYSIYKETDFATNLYSGPYRESNLSSLVKKLKET